jgi:hypothetical protein
VKVRPAALLQETLVRPSIEDSDVTTYLQQVTNELEAQRNRLQALYKTSGNNN